MRLGKEAVAEAREEGERETDSWILLDPAPGRKSVTANADRDRIGERGGQTRKRAGGASACAAAADDDAAEEASPGNSCDIIRARLSAARNNDGTGSAFRRRAQSASHCEEWRKRVWHFRHGGQRSERRRAEAEAPAARVVRHGAGRSLGLAGFDWGRSSTEPGGEAGNKVSRSARGTAPTTACGREPCIRVWLHVSDRPRSERGCSGCLLLDGCVRGTLCTESALPL
ncbi:conserved hypothetical protein [Ixodes scapularis]|uniref:Uncharacterized protein n=1 Tax=Ixodes scapularis TaxID=6945 RepID=B7P1D6_IXOSC|nr:conserved hypothetical protein [Ixodes scapularis]|eukprot:XP_002433344.1 conserved hypothetical protein [Ixodes scapularis]